MLAHCTLFKPLCSLVLTISSQRLHISSTLVAQQPFHTACLRDSLQLVLWKLSQCPDDVGEKWQFWGHRSVALDGSSGVEEPFERAHHTTTMVACHFPPTAVTTENPRTVKEKNSERGAHLYRCRQIWDCCCDPRVGSKVLRNSYLNRKPMAQGQSSLWELWELIWADFGLFTIWAYIDSQLPSLISPFIFVWSISEANPKNNWMRGGQAFLIHP